MTVPAAPCWHSICHGCDPFVVRLISSSATNNDGINNAVHCQCNTRCRLQTGDQRWEIWAGVVITTSSFVWLQPSSPVLATPPSSTSVPEMDKWTLSGRILHFYKAIFTGDNYCQILRARVLRCCAPLWVLLSCSNITNALNTWNQFEYQSWLTSGWGGRRQPGIHNKTHTVLSVLIIRPKSGFKLFVNYLLSK